MIRVLHLFKTATHHTHGGIEVFIDTLANAQHQLHLPVQHTLFALAPNCAATHTTPHLTTHCHPQQLALRSTPISLTALPHLAQHLARAHLLHLHYPYPFADALLFAHTLRTRTPLPPILITYHSDIVKQKWLEHLYRPLRTWLFRRAARIVATSHNLKASSPTLARYLSKTTVIPLPSPIPPAYTPPPPTPTFFLYLGGLRYYKGLPTLIAAAAKAQLPVHIAGSGPDEPYLKRLAQRYRAPITWHGAVDEATKKQLLANCTALILPSTERSEAFGLVLLEAAAYGRPAITTELGTGTSEIVEHGKTGYVVPPKDPQALAHAMTTLWHLPLEQRTALGQAAYAKATTHYAQATIARAYYSCYQQHTQNQYN